MLGSALGGLGDRWACLPARRRRSGQGGSGKGQFCGMCWRTLRVRGEKVAGRLGSGEDGGHKG